MFRTLERDSLYFRRKGTAFRPRAAEQVAAERRRHAREREKEEFRERVAGLLRRGLAGDPPVDSGEWNTIAERLERWLRQRDKDDVGSIFEQITGEAQAREAAYDLLVRLGRIKDQEDRFLLVRGFPTVFPADTLEAAESLAPGDCDDRADWTMHAAVAIDDEETVEIDDALTLIESGDEWIVGIHIADVSAFTVKGDPLDREAARRTATIYLPNGSVPMFPPRLSSDLSSLVPHVERPAFTVEARFDRSGGLRGFRLIRTRIRVSGRMTYEEADSLLASDAAIRTLHELAGHLRDARNESGAQTHRRPEIKVHVKGGAIAIRRLEVETPSRLIVSEMMILANRLAADHAGVEGIPIIYRTQEPPHAEPPNVEGLAEALQFELLRKSFKRSRLSLSPAPHAGLGLGAYTQMSSPIRRYADLITQRQFVAAMRGEPFPYANDELLRVMTLAEATEVDIRRLEQSSTTYWVLTYLSLEKMREPLQAIVLDGKGTVELIDYLVRGKALAAEEWTPGQTVTVEIESIRPMAGEIRFRACI
jgi:exoribonuclease-2